MCPNRDSNPQPLSRKSCENLQSELKPLYTEHSFQPGNTRLLPFISTEALTYCDGSFNKSTGEILRLCD